MNKNSRSFSLSGAVPDDQLNKIYDTAIVALLRSIRPHAVKLADSWKFPDYLLDRYVQSVLRKVWTDANRRLQCTGTI